MLDFLFTKTPLLYLTQNFWRDEAFTYVLAKNPFTKILSITAHDFNPPLYYLVMNIWIKIFGSSEIAMRSLSLLFYAGTVITVCFILEKIFKFREKKAYVYLLVFLFNPLLFYNAFEARMYAMLAFFATLSWYFLKRGKSKSYIVTAVLGLYTHYFMILVIASQVAYILASHFTSRKVKIRDFKEIAISGLLFLPWLLYVASLHAFGQESFWILPLQFNTYTHMPSLLYTGYELDAGFFDKYIWGLTIFFNVVPLYGLIRLRKQKKEYQDLYVLLTSWTFIPVFITFGLSLFKPLFLPRYLIASSVGLSLLLIYVLDEFPRLLGVILTAVLVLYSAFYLQLHVANRGKAPIKNTIAEIRGAARKNEPLYVTDELDFFTAQYYFDPQRVFIYSKIYQEIPSYTGKVLIPESRIVHSLPSYPKKAFVLNNDLSYSIQALY